LDQLKKKYPTTPTTNKIIPITKSKNFKITNPSDKNNQKKIPPITQHFKKIKETETKNIGLSTKETKEKVLKKEM